MDWRIWRVVSAGFATLREVEEHWSIDDLLDALDVLDVQAEAEWLTRAQAPLGSG